MSDPLTDMSLLPPPEPLNLYPLDPVPLEHYPHAWARQVRRRAKGQTELWRVSRWVRHHLPGWPLLAAEGPFWRTWPGTPTADPIIELLPGYEFDGASGPAIDDPEALIAASCHDPATQRIDGLMVMAIGASYRGFPKVCPSWWRRARLYGAILSAQGESRFRVAYSTAAVAAYDLVVEPIVWRVGECK